MFGKCPKRIVVLFCPCTNAAQTRKIPIIVAIFILIIGFDIRMAISPPGGDAPGGRSFNLTGLKFEVQIRLEQLILIHRVDGQVAEPSGPDGVVDLPRVRPRKIDGHGIS